MEIPPPAGKMSAVEGDLVGIEIGGTKLQMLVGPEPARRSTRPDWEDHVRPADGGPGIQRQIRAGLVAIGAIGGGRRIRAIGVGFGGPINRRTGRITRSHQIDGWENFPLADWLRGQLVAHGAQESVKVAVDNDANVAALGEACHGAGRGFDPVFYVTLGSGVGGGLVVGGSIYHGAPPGEAEFGHLRLGGGRAGPFATVESRCSGWAIDKRTRDAVAAGNRRRAGFLAGAVARQHADGKTGNEAAHLQAALAAHDPLAERLLGELSDDLALALSHVAHLLHPALIVLGGGLSGIGEPLRAAVAAKLPSTIMEAFHPCPEVRLAELGKLAVPVGAMELARRTAREGTKT